MVAIRRAPEPVNIPTHPRIHAFMHPRIHASMRQRNHPIRHNNNRLPLRYHNDQLIFRGTQDATTKLFHLDLQSLINLPTPSPPYHTIPSFQKPRNTPITAQTIRDALWLHKRMGHASRQQMATAIQSGSGYRAPSPQPTSTRS